MGKEVLLKAEGIYKSFGPTKALVNVDFTIKRGEIHGLIGENGSGKSTFSTIVAGIQNADAGTMYFCDKPYHPKNILDAVSQGVGMIVQEQGTLNDLSVASNIFAGKEQDFIKGGFINLKKMNEKAKELLNQIGVNGINAENVVNQMSFEDRKLLEVARVKYTNPELLIIDETTTALGKESRNIMYNMIREMRKEGKGIIFISHDIEELVEMCDAVTVLRDGMIIGTLEKDEMDIPKMKQMMVGREIAENFYRGDYEGRQTDQVILKGEHICYQQLKEVEIKLHKGEILGVGGLADSGMHELGKILFGLITPDVGIVKAQEKAEIRSSKDAVKASMGYVAKNRDTEALMGGGNIKENMCLAVLPKIKRAGLVLPRKENEIVSKWKEKLSIKMKSSNQFCMHLSGGNKQKVSIAKWLATDPDIIIFDCPTRGIDIGVKSDIYRLLEELKREGKGILMISEELPELIGMSDRILIFKDGVISKEFERSENLTESILIDYMI